METARFRGVLGKLGGWDAFGGRSGRFGHVRRRFRAPGGSPELGRAGDSVVIIEHVDGDVAVGVDALGVAVGWWCVTRVCGACWGSVYGVGRLLDRR